MLHLHQWGPVSESPLVLLHGFMGDGSDWGQVAGRMGRTCLAPDLPGHGASIGQPQEAYALSGAADAVLATLDALGVDGFDLCGYSMGGRVALSVVRAAPGRVRRLVLESAHPGLGDPSERVARLELDRVRAEALRTGTLIDFVQAWYAAPLFASLAARHDLLGRVIAKRCGQHPLELARAIVGYSLGTQLDAAADGVLGAVPTLLISGQSDARYSALLRERARPLDHVHHASIAAAGHNVHLEDPAAFSAAVMAFLA